MTQIKNVGVKAIFDCISACSTDFRLLFLLPFGRYLSFMGLIVSYSRIFDCRVSGFDDWYLVCSPTPCLNGAPCVALNSNTDFYCVCPTNIPVTGKRCDQLNIGSTTTSSFFFLLDFRLTFSSIATSITVSPCTITPCLNGGVCTFSQFSNTYTCSCGLTYYGTRCESMPIRIVLMNSWFLLLDINRCYYQPTICQNGGTCVPGSDGAFSCRCPVSYGGIYCEQFIQAPSLIDYHDK